VVDLSSNPADIVLIDEHLPRVWHTAAAPEADASDTPAAVAAPLRSVLRFYRRHSGGEFSSNAPVFVSSEQVFPAQMMESISELVGQPVSALPAPPRVPANVRHSTYLACLGLLMRRKS
jgi:hypothetical protein